MRPAWPTIIMAAGTVVALLQPAAASASDYTANSLLAFALGASGLG